MSVPDSRNEHASGRDLVVRGRELSKRFVVGKAAEIIALDRVSIAAQRGALTALVGPDGAGKTTLLRLIAGLMRPDAGELEVLGIDAAAEPQRIQDLISYMPQRFGLYEDLSVQENLDLYADLHGVTRAERQERYPRLMSMTALAPFVDRLAGKLSGGMKQKLGLACTLVRAPELLLLDEPTVGVDPLSRRELWEIVHGLVDRDGLSVLVSTSYMDEAALCERVNVLHEGRVLAAGEPEEIRQLAEGRSWLASPPPDSSSRRLQVQLMSHAEAIDAVPQGGKVRMVSRDKHAPAVAAVALEPISARFEDGFMILLRQEKEASARTLTLPESIRVGTSPSVDTDVRGREIVIQVRDLVRRFGDFTAVNHTSFDVNRGEIFGLLGPNGAGKTTTFRMLCGLLPATGGALRVAGADLRRARAEARARIGYVAQKFSLYGDLSVRENLEFFGGAYGLRNSRLRERIAWAVEQFELAPMLSLPAQDLPGGHQRRLAMAAALLHEPEILFLDEPTSGADPLARREFWARITMLADAGVTIVVTTHFMEEAEYCDRILIQDAGSMLALGAPEEVRRNAGPDVETMEQAFIAIVERAREARAAA